LVDKGEEGGERSAAVRKKKVTDQGSNREKPDQKLARGKRGWATRRWVNEGNGAPPKEGVRSGNGSLMLLSGSEDTQKGRRGPNAEGETSPIHRHPSKR